MKTSIIMATYNGERFIIQQLKSILRQTRQVDEVLIRDDKSTDNTVELIENFIAQNKLDNWKIQINDFNKGWRGNFIDLMNEANGELIFFSDQDDIWHIDKVETMSNIMETNYNIHMLFGESISIDEEERLVSKQTNSFNKKISKIVSKVNFSEKFIHKNALGCTMCISKELAQKVYTLNFYDLGHDAQCFRLSLILNSAYKLSTPVILRRIHNDNVTNPGQSNSFSISLDKENRINKIYRNIEWIETVLENYQNDIFIYNERITTIYSTITFLRDRLKLCEKRKISSLIHLLKNHKYYMNIKMLFGDIYIAYFYKSN
ncbi:glycosyltransferase [Virgibacillus salinus]|uniref:Glycosyltransferase, GT2 family n=1 Tax=Virgibacillus salinus TaxID=553311 RepID=A0A1H0YJ51_9BACI|nr:glycosyltransferase [Virgibacillus salinus]SDQ14941.1 Glycosyltransferase, GT2 family [Virgibacillus salinus]